MFDAKDWKLFKKGAMPMFGKAFVILIFVLIAVTLVLWGISEFFGWVSSPFTAIGDGVGGAWDWATGWIGSGEETVLPEPVVTPAEAGDDEPGWICSRWSKWNPGC